MKLIFLLTLIVGCSTLPNVPQKDRVCRGLVGEALEDCTLRHRGVEWQDYMRI